MPTYDYFCTECKHALETMHKITAPPLRTCPACHKDGLVRRPGGGIGLSFSGDGFYATMYGQSKSNNETASTTPPPSGGGCCPCGKGSCNKE